MKPTKFCRYCQLDLPIESFATRRASPDGRSYKCRSCDRAYRTARPATHYKALRRATYEKNRDAERAAALTYYQKNRDRLLALHVLYMRKTAEQQRRYRHEKRDVYAAHLAARRASLEQRTPPWLTNADFAVMRLLYAAAKAISKNTGVTHHVDHIVPLRGRSVSGLHVPWNLQVISAARNMSKSNRHE